MRFKYAYANANRNQKTDGNFQFQGTKMGMGKQFPGYLPVTFRERNLRWMFRHVFFQINE
jgi:hypothetical protein